jgi:hypothetical protein
MAKRKWEGPQRRGRWLGGCYGNGTEVLEPHPSCVTGGPGGPSNPQYTPPLLLCHLYPCLFVDVSTAGWRVHRLCQMAVAPAASHALIAPISSFTTPLSHQTAAKAPTMSDL